MGLRKEISTVIGGLHFGGRRSDAGGLRKEISIGLWVWRVLIEKFVGIVGMVSLSWV